jgi:hypothetical protein
MNYDGVRAARLDRLRDTVEDWVRNLDTVIEMHAMIEVAVLMAVADGDVSAPEYEQLAATIEFATNQHVGPGRVRSMLQRFTESLRLDGWEKRIAQVASSIAAAPARRVAYRLAAGVSFVDGWVQEDEARLFGLLAQAFNIPFSEASEILTDVRDSLFGSDEPTQTVILLEPSRRRQRTPSEE